MDHTQTNLYQEGIMKRKFQLYMVSRPLLFLQAYQKNSALEMQVPLRHFTKVFGLIVLMLSLCKWTVMKYKSNTNKLTLQASRPLTEVLVSEHF